MSTSTYPIQVRSLSLDHKGGTKSYHLMLIQTDDDRAVVVLRWGKTGQFGEIQTKHFDHVTDAFKEYERKERDKTRNGYGASSVTKHVQAADKSELSKAIGLAVFNKMGKDAVAFLDPTYDTSGMRESEIPRLNEDGRLVAPDTSRKADLSESLDAIRAAEKLETEAALAEIPTFGMF